MLLRLFFTFILFCVLLWQWYAADARINNISIVQSNTEWFTYQVISNSREVLLKYLLWDETLFKIEGEWFDGFQYKGSLIIEIWDKEYESTTYDTRNSQSIIYFKSNNIRDVLLESGASSFSFKFCPMSEVYWKLNCTQSYRIQIDNNQSISNDTYSDFQYYFKDSNIMKAKDSVISQYTPVIAIIDDGISLQHEDLLGNTWFNSDEIRGNGIDDDQNWYIDDYLAWNFVDDSNNMSPKGSHATNVSGIIGANTNNNIWIAGVSNSSKLMSLIACDDSGCWQDDIVDAINYAVDNRADIINMSIAGKWFSYNAEVTQAIEYAKNNNVVVVVSAWNWDGGLTSLGINTSDFKISPVCNETNSSDIIGVSALSLFSDLTRNGSKTVWTNYGACSDIDAYGERITTLSKDGDYDILDGTSYSAPIVTWVIALWFNKFWKQDSEVVFQALQKSKNTWHGIDASLYLKNLESEIAKANKNEIINQQVEEIEIDQENKNTALYEKLDTLERDRPWILQVLLPGLKSIRGNEKYRKHWEIIEIIIAYIEEKY